METVLVTGAARGIGLSLVEHFVDKGLAVIATHRGNAGEALTQLAESRGVELHMLDVTDEVAVAALGATLADRPVDLLVNNAGVLGPENQSRDALYSEAWLQTFKVNALAPLWFSNAMLPALRRAANPRIVTLSSQMGSLNHAGEGLYAYRGSKAALNKFMQVLAQELRAEGITVCPVHPGWVRTDMGGTEADIPVEESAAGIVELALSLSLENSGNFYTWDGRIHPW